MTWCHGIVFLILLRESRGLKKMFKYPDLDEKYRVCQGMTDLSGNTLLYELIHNVKMMEQWDKPGMDYSYRTHMMSYLAIVEYILQKLEVMECGSIGGFGKGQVDRSLAGRIDWQIRRLR
jgi:hypothetical protein